MISTFRRWNVCQAAGQRHAPARPKDRMVVSYGTTRRFLALVEDVPLLWAATARLKR
jgi:hypothetical protein